MFGKRVKMLSTKACLEQRRWRQEGNRKGDYRNCVRGGRGGEETEMINEHTDLLVGKETL